MPHVKAVLNSKRYVKYEHKRKLRTATSELKDRLVSIQRVKMVTKGWSAFSFSAIVVVGNETASWATVWVRLRRQAASPRVSRMPRRTSSRCPVIKGTVPHEVETRFGGAQVLIKPAAAGTGLKAGGAMRAVLESAGITDVIAKSKGSSNPHNLVKATISALTQMRDAYSVAQVRGISMDKVFNG